MSHTVGVWGLWAEQNAEFCIILRVFWDLLHKTVKQNLTVTAQLLAQHHQRQTFYVL